MAEVAPVRAPVERAQLLPARVFHDPDVFAYEEASWFATSWLCVGREEDVAAPGTYLLARVAGEGVIVVRGRDGVARAFNNVCRHRGSTLVDEPADGSGSGSLVRIQCPYHAWIYDLDGSLKRAPHTEEIEDFVAADNGLFPVRLEAWAGFLFVNLDPDAAPLLDYLADLPRAVERYPIAGLRRARRIEYDVHANWKVIGENYSECYHCPGVHPQLNRLSPYDRGRNLESTGPWAGGWMELIEAADTMSTDGASHGRPPLRGIGDENTRRVYYIVLWPNLLLSLHPDYVMTHQVLPVDAERSRVVCEWLFHPDTLADPGNRIQDAIEFWDLTNRQDWDIVEQSQLGVASRRYAPGPYSPRESVPAAWDREYLRLMGRS